jgi:hypothetical protein
VPAGDTVEGDSRQGAETLFLLLSRLGRELLAHLSQPRGDAVHGVRRHGEVEQEVDELLRRGEPEQVLHPALDVVHPLLRAENLGVKVPVAQRAPPLVLLAGDGQVGPLAVRPRLLPECVLVLGQPPDLPRRVGERQRREIQDSRNGVERVKEGGKPVPRRLRLGRPPQVGPLVDRPCHQQPLCLTEQRAGRARRVPDRNYVRSVSAVDVVGQAPFDRAPHEIGEARQQQSVQQRQDAGLAAAVAQPDDGVLRLAGAVRRGREREREVLEARGPLPHGAEAQRGELIGHG